MIKFPSNPQFRIKREKMKVNTIYNEDCLGTMRRIESGVVDLIVTSPPYDDLRHYNGYRFHFKHIARHMYRIVADGGVVVWIVGDGTINGSETGTSFKQALFFMECGFRLHDTMIWEKESFRSPANGRYHQVFEYMFVFSKGKPKTFNRIEDRKNIYAGRVIHGTQRLPDGSMRPCNNNGQVIGEFGGRHNVWKINSDRQQLNHPAPFPETIAHDHIVSWSNEGDLIYDPFSGSGTTLKMAHILNRKWIGSEISAEYTVDANNRIHPHLITQTLF